MSDESENKSDTETRLQTSGVPPLGPDLSTEAESEDESVALDPNKKTLNLWLSLDEEARVTFFLALEEELAESLFLKLGTREQAALLMGLPIKERRSWLRSLAPDDAADLVQEIPEDRREEFFQNLDRVTKKEVAALLAYAEDEAGGLMSPRYARLRPEMSVDEAITYLRRQARRPIETIFYAYVLDHDQHLLGVVSFRDLFLEQGTRVIKDIMQTEVISARENTPQEDVGMLLTENNLLALPVVDDDGVLKGIVTVDDVLEVIEEETTADIQKIGGTEALEAPYLEVNFWKMIYKRAGWLSSLFIGESFTTSTMSHFQVEIEKALVLSLFIPLVISSGGNSGSQASTIIVRALALNEVRPKLWHKVFVRELGAGLTLGLILGALGFLRIMLWPNNHILYTEHYQLVALTVAGSLVGIVLWGSLCGAMLPILLKRLKFDPASASAPSVATLVDITGLAIYFSIASYILRGILL
jgi:magnesium transporter